MASGRVIHREMFQNANQMVEVLVRTKPKLPYSSAPMPTTGKFKRDCLLQKELDQIPEERNAPQKYNQLQTQRTSKDKHAKSSKKRNSNMVVEVSKRNGHSRKKGHNSNHLDHTWRDLLKECSSIKHNESASSGAGSDNVDHIPSKEPSEKSSKQDRAIQTSRSVRDKNSNLQHIVNRHNENLNNPGPTAHGGSSPSSLHENYAGISQSHPADEPAANHVHAHHNQANYATNRPANAGDPAANRAGAGGRLSSDGLSSTPFSESALQLLQQLRHKLQNRGDSESSEMLGVLEQYFAGAAAGSNKPPTPQSSHSSPYTTVFNTPQANAPPQFIQQLLQERAEQQRLNVQQAATIAELRHLSSRLLAQHAKDSGNPGSNATAAAAPLPLNATASRLVPVAPSTALSPLIEVSHESSGHQTLVPQREPDVEDHIAELSGLHYQIYPHVSGQGMANADDMEANSRLQHAVRMYPPQLREGATGPLGVRNAGGNQPETSTHAGPAPRFEDGPPRVAGAEPGTDDGRPRVAEAEPGSDDGRPRVGRSAAVSRASATDFERTNTALRPGGEARLGQGAAGNLVEELRAEIWSLRSEIEWLKKQKAGAPPLHGIASVGNGSSVTQQPLASTARSAAAPVGPPANSSNHDLQARGPPPELSSVRNSQTQAGLRVTTTMPTLPSTQEHPSRERQPPSTDINTDIFRSDNVQQITTVNPSLLEATTVGGAFNNTAKEQPAQIGLVKSKTSSELSEEGRPIVLRSDSSRYAERPISRFGNEVQIPRKTNKVVREPDVICSIVSDVSEDEPKSLSGGYQASAPSSRGFPASGGNSEGLSSGAPRVVRNGLGVRCSESPDFGTSTSSISGCLMGDNSDTSRDTNAPVNRRLESTRVRESDESEAGVSTSNSGALPKANFPRARGNFEASRTSVNPAKSLATAGVTNTNVNNNSRMCFSESEHFQPLVFSEDECLESIE